MPTIIKKDQIADYIGFQAEPTPWHEITQSQINQFADCTLDHQFIHVDEEKAKLHRLVRPSHTDFCRCLCCRILLKTSALLSQAFIWA